jgi:hypothetical protein
VPDGGREPTGRTGDNGWATGISIAESVMDTDNGIKDGNRIGQQELLQEIGRLLIEGSPEGWSRIDLRAPVAATQDLMALTVLMPDHSSPHADLRPSVGLALRELRELMYVEGRGTWFSLRYTMDPPAAFHVVYNHDFDPKWSPDLSPHEWALDLERFPLAGARQALDYCFTMVLAKQ